MRRLRIFLSLAAASAIVPLAASAQTCSCAAVPLVGSMQTVSPNEGEWFVGTTYEFHEISDLVAGSSTIPDTTGRDRTSAAMVLEASRGLTDKWSISVLASAIEHERAVGGSSVTTSGQGDSVIVAKYSPRRISLYSDSALSFAFGRRIATGADDVTQRRIAVAEDLQPSTGADGSIASFYWARAMNDSTGKQIYASASYADNGDNDRAYEFGDVLVLAVGGTIETQSSWGYSLGLSYRNSKRDRRALSDIPNTGGEWVDLSAGFQYRITESVGIGLGARFPIARDLNDELQFTTKFAVSASVSYVFGNTQ